MIPADLEFHTLASLARVLVSLILALGLAVPAALAAGLNRGLDRVATPLAAFLYPVPKIALLPVFIVVLGLGEVSKVALLTTVLVFPLYLAVRDGCRDIPSELFEAARSLGLRGAALVRHLAFPAILPRLFSSLRVVTGIALSVLFFAENWATDYGLGSFVMNRWAVFKYADMAWGIGALAVLGLILFGLTAWVEGKVCPWKPKD